MSGVSDQLTLPRALKVPLEGIVVSSDPQLPARCSGHGLTLSVFTPFASPTSPVGRVGDVDRGDFGDIEHTLVVDFPVIMPTIGIGYSAHSPELPQFSSVQLEAVPWTALESNKMHSAFASSTAVRITRPMRSGHGVHSPSAVSALSDLSHYQPV